MRKYNKSINTRTKIHLSVQFHLFWTEGHARGRGGGCNPHIFWDAVQSIVQPEMETTHCELEAQSAWSALSIVHGSHRGCESYIHCMWYDELNYSKNIYLVTGMFYGCVVIELKFQRVRGLRWNGPKANEWHFPAFSVNNWWWLFAEFLSDNKFGQRVRQWTR